MAEGWQPLLTALQDRIRAVDTEARLTSARFDEHGVMRLRADASTDRRAEVNRLLRRCESQMLSQCELCGGAGQVYAGVILTMRCEGCVSRAASR
ncbi:MAG TPA: hypothetical protein VGH93_06360 [Solirubrobacteraceae bacterium]